MPEATALQKWDAEVEAIANHFADLPFAHATSYMCDACHDEGYILIGGDQDRPCPECTYDGFHDGPYGPDGDWGGDAA